MMVVDKKARGSPKLLQLILRGMSICASGFTAVRPIMVELEEFKVIKIDSPDNKNICTKI